MLRHRMNDAERIPRGVGIEPAPGGTARTCHILLDWLGYAPDRKPNRIASHCVQLTVAAHADHLAAMLKGLDEHGRVLGLYSSGAAKCFSAAIPYGRITSFGLNGWSSVRSRCCVIAEELNQQSTDQFRLLLLYPMSGAIEKMKSNHIRAGGIAHPVDRTRRLIDAPIAFSRDELRGHVYRAA